MAKNMEIALLFDFYGDMLTEKQQDMIELYYENDLSLAEIAENEGITRQGVRDAIKRAENQLVEMEERLGLARRFREMREQFDAIKDAAGNIAAINDRFGYSRDIAEQARRILQLTQKLSEY
ncbi:MAG: YlxM family DNA-binding protein [Clostridia bacterium]|nr:YlxM family DNA-binding protein [Clostridia bacterium]MBQ7302653.1 YlxM family DNA-binding protein [Clostridia bacterium]